MRRIGSISLAVLAAGVVGIALAGGIAATDRPHAERHGFMKWVVVDDDGTRHDRTVEIDGPRARLGVALASADDGGARIGSVVEGSAAARAGLLAGDVVVAFDGREIESPWDLTAAVLESRPGDRVALEIRRDGRSETLTAELDEADDWGPAFAFGDIDIDIDADALHEHLEQLHELELDIPMEQLHEHLEALGERLEGLDLDLRFGEGAGHRFMMRAARPRLGIEAVGVTPELREHLGAERDRGVLVGRVLGDTPAMEAGVEVGDLIVAVDGEVVTGAGDLRRLLAERAGETFGIDVIRDRVPLALTVSLPPSERDEL